jgi:hypothetical protein
MSEIFVVALLYLGITYYKGGKILISVYVLHNTCYKESTSVRKTIHSFYIKSMVAFSVYADSDR